jgi:glutaredoxin
MKRIQLFLFIFFFTFLLAIQLGSTKIFAQTNSNTKTDVVVFLREGCQHCKNEEAFLKKLQRERDDIRITTYRLENHTQRQIWETFTTLTKISKVTPITVIGERYLIGFDTPETTGKEILSLIDTAQKTGTKTNLENNDLQLGSTAPTCVEDATIPCTVTNKQPYYLSIPFFGKIDTANYPLLALSVLLGFFDGFNPCALWVLITFLIILMQLGNRKKMFLFAGTFILAEAIMYALILTVWFKTWDFVQLDTIITPIVGILAIGGGLFFLNEYRKKEIECKVTNIQQRHHIKKRIEALAFGKFTFHILGILCRIFGQY